MRDIRRLPITRIQNRLGLLPYLQFHEALSINGKKVIIPVKDRTSLRFVARSETWMSDILRRLFEVSTGALVDVGINIGQTLIEAKTINPDLRYLVLSLIKLASSL